MSFTLLGIAGIDLVWRIFLYILCNWFVRPIFFEFLILEVFRICFFNDIFVLRSPGGRCNWLSSMTFVMCLLHLICKAPFLIFFQIVDVFRHQNFYIKEYKHFFQVSAIDLAWWNILCTLYNWFARPILLIFFKFWYWKKMYQLFISFFNFFNKRLTVMNFYISDFHLIPRPYFI